MDKSMTTQDVGLTDDERKTIDMLRVDLHRLRVANMALDAELGETNLQLASAQRENSQLLAEVSALKGEAEITVYVGQTSPRGAVTDVSYGLGRTSEDLARQYKHCTQDVFAVRLSARKVEP